MKYIIMMFGDQNTMMETRSPEWIREMIGFMQKIDQEIKDAGEFVDGQGLVDPSEAKTRPTRERHAGGDRWPVRRGQGVPRGLVDHRC